MNVGNLYDNQKKLNINRFQLLICIPERKKNCSKNGVKEVKYTICVYTRNEILIFIELLFQITTNGIESLINIS